METTININGKDVKITLTADQIAKIKKQSTNVMERIKTLEDACNDQGVDFQEFKHKNKDLPKDEYAYKALKIINRALNENTEPNWDDENEKKWFPWFDLRNSGAGFVRSGCGGWASVTDGGSRLCFRKKELSDYAAVQFNDLYKDFIR